MSGFKFLNANKEKNDKKLRKVLSTVNTWLSEQCGRHTITLYNLGENK